MVRAWLEERESCREGACLKTGLVREEQVPGGCGGSLRPVECAFDVAAEYFSHMFPWLLC